MRKLAFKCAKNILFNLKVQTYKLTFKSNVSKENKLFRGTGTNIYHARCYEK